MKETRSIMSMPVTVAIAADDARAHKTAADIFAFFESVDERFSPFKPESEVSRMARGEVLERDASVELTEILTIARRAKVETNGFFDVVRPDGRFDPSGVVKGWAIREAAARTRAAGFSDFFLNVGGDIASSGVGEQGAPWSIGIRNPFNGAEIVKVVYPHGKGVATSGSYERGAHIYNPHAPSAALDDVVSVTVVGPDVLEADLMATAAFAMGKDGAAFIASLPGFEAYHITKDGMAAFTSGFSAYLTHE